MKEQKPIEWIAEEKSFAIWLYENHFILFDIQNGLHFFKSESWGNRIIDIDTLYNIFNKR